MKLNSIFFVLAIPALAFSVSGCSDTSLRTGISPVLDVQAVRTAATNQTTIIDALAADAGLAYSDPEYYYRAAEAGFNFVDDQCSAYFDSMFFFDRRRDELTSGLAAAGAATGAILGVTGASAKSLAIVASSFGFGSNATDIVAGTYVFAHPSETKVMVERFQKAFRDAAYASRAKISSRSSAYYMVQRYLSLCLPPTIEAAITRQIDATTVFPAPAGGGSLVSLRTASSQPTTPVAVPKSRTAFVAPVRSAQERAPAAPKPVLRNPTGLSSFEKHNLDRETILGFESLLCLSTNGDVVSLRKGMIDFFRKPSVLDTDRADQIEKRGILQGDLDQVSTLAVNEDCHKK